jgi:hypothetical protein
MSGYHGHSGEKHGTFKAWMVVFALWSLPALWVGGQAAWHALTDPLFNMAHHIIEQSQPLDREALVPPCATEDAPGPCYWDADTMGNGEGKSFTVDRFGNVTYWGE